MHEQTAEQYVTAIVAGFAQYPDEIKIDRVEDEQGILLNLTVAPEDMGRVLGKQGENANAIRKILRSYGFKNKQTVSLKVLDRNRAQNNQ